MAFAEQGDGRPGLLLIHSRIHSLLDAGPAAFFGGLEFDAEFAGLSEGSVPGPMEV